MKYDVIVNVCFIGVEAASEGEAQELVDDAIGAVLFNHPTTQEEVASVYDTREVG